MRDRVKDNIVRTKSFSFAIRIVKLYKFLIGKNSEFVLSKQLLRSGTAIGAMIREADFAESRADFIHKTAIAQKECNETLYWLELLYETDYITQTQYDSINQNAVELMKLITSIIKTAKANNHK